MRLIKLLLAGIQRPNLAWRHMTGRGASTIHLSEISPFISNTPTIIEAGACDGADTLAFLKAWPGATVFAFEPVPSLFALAHKALRGDSRVMLENRALGPAGCKELLLWSGDADNHSSSALAPTKHTEMFPEVRFTSEILVPATSLDEYVRSRSISQIDLLWLDLQGFELEVLRSGGMNALAITEAIHIEVARERAYDGAVLREEILEFLESNGFELILERVPMVFGNALLVRNNQIK